MKKKAKKLKIPLVATFSLKDIIGLVRTVRESFLLCRKLDTKELEGFLFHWKICSNKLLDRKLMTLRMVHRSSFPNWNTNTKAH
jgi:hypothetical protein